MTFRIDQTVDVNVPKGVSVMKTQDGTDTVDVHYYAGDPNGNIAADIGSLTLDVTNGTPWYKTTDTVNTGWVQIDITPAADSSITEGALATAGSDRTVNMDGNTLSFENVGLWVVEATGAASFTSSAFNIQGAGASQGSITLYDGDNSHNTTIRSNFSGSASYTLTLPAAGPSSSGQVMSFTNGGVASFIDLPADTNITTGSVAAATGARNIPLDSNSLTFSDVNGFTVALDNAAATQFTTDTFTISASTAGTKPSLTLDGISGSTSIVAANAPTPYTITLPSAAPGSDGQFMSFTTAGIASFVDPPDTNITTGTVAAATGPRTIPFGGQNLTLQNTGDVSIETQAGDWIKLESNRTIITDPDGVGGELWLQGLSTGGYIYLRAPQSNVTNYYLTLPGAAPGADDKVMSFDALGTATFTDFVAANITEGTLNAAGDHRTVNLATYDLTFSNVPVVELNNGADDPSQLRFKEDSANGMNYIGIAAPSAVTSNIVYKLPEAPASNGQVLQANTDGTMSWLTLNAPMHLEGNIDVGGGATFVSPAGYDEGSWLIVTNAHADGTVFGIGGPTVFTGDSVVVKDGIASSASNTGIHWMQIDSATDVTSVQVGTGESPSTGAVVIHDATTSSVGLIEIATSAETLAGSDWTVAVTPPSLKAKVDRYTATYPSSPQIAGATVTITHNLGFSPVQVTCYDFVTKQEVHPKITQLSTNTIGISHALSTSTGEFVVHVTRVAS